MTKVLIVYATDYGNTKKLAEVIGSGAKEVPQTDVKIKTAEDVTKEDVIECDALILGSPVHMGSMDWRVKKFIDTVCSSLWMKDLTNGKVCGVFASGGGFGSAGGGVEITMLSMLNNFAEMGFIYIPLPKNTPGYRHGGLQWGPYGRSLGLNMEPAQIHEEALECAKHHGANIARAAHALANQSIFGKFEHAKK